MGFRGRGVFVLASILVAVFASLAVSSASGSYGTLDSSFGNAGIVSNEVTAGAPELLSGAYPLSDGKIVAVGYELGLNGYDTRLSMHTNNGALDTSWGSNGYVVHANTGPQLSSLIDTQGRPITVSLGQNNEVDIRRYLPDGTLDNSFGNSGIAQRPAAFSQLSADLLSVIVDNTGRLLIGTGNPTGANADFYVYRLTANGLLDNSFGVNGEISIDLGAAEAVGAMAVDSTGRIVLGGYRVNGSAIGYALARLTTDGILDPDFGSAGSITGTLPGSDSSFVFRLAVTNDDHVLVGFLRGINYQFSLVVQRFLSNGTVDGTFNEIVAVTETEENILPLLMRTPDDGIVTVTYDQINGALVPNATTVRAFSKDGVPDSIFGSNGQTQINGAVLVSLKYDSADNMLLGGFTYQPAVPDPVYNRTMARLLAAPTVSTTTPAPTTTATVAPKTESRVIKRELPRTGVTNLWATAVALVLLGGMTIAVNKRFTTSSRDGDL